MKKYIIGAIVGAILSGVITYTLKPIGYTKVNFSKIEMKIKPETNRNDRNSVNNKYILPEDAKIVSGVTSNQYISCKKIHGNELNCSIMADKDDKLIPFNFN
jgi:hypothetical protein